MSEHNDLIRRLREQHNPPCGRIFGMSCVRCDAADALEAASLNERRLHGLLMLHHSDAMELWKALNDLSFECDGVIGYCNRPSVDTYNRTFAVMQKHRPSYDPSRRNADSAGNAALSGEGVGDE